MLTHSAAYGLMRIRAGQEEGSHVMMRTQSSGETEAAQPIGQSRLGGGVVLTSVTWPIAHRAQRVDEPGGRRVSQKSTSRSSVRMRGLKPGTEREGRAWRRGGAGRARLTEKHHAGGAFRRAGVTGGRSRDLQPAPAFHSEFLEKRSEGSR